MTSILEAYGLNAKAGEVGIEIEMEGKGLATRAEGWLVTEDGSLRGESAEYVLEAPVSRDDVSGSLSTLQEALKKSKLFPSDRCGVHIHINCQRLTTVQVLNFALLYLIFEEPLIKWCGESREGNLFCLRAKDAEYLVEALIDARKKNSLRGFQNEAFRYASINLSAIGKYGSLEFRSMETPTNFEVINKWVRILLAIKDESLKATDPQDIIHSISGAGSLAYAKAVFGPLLAEIKCPGMDRMILDGVRRVQDVAYVAAPKKAEEKAPIKKAAPDRAAEVAEGDIIEWRRQVERAMRAADPFVAPPPPRRRVAPRDPGEV